MADNVAKVGIEVEDKATKELGSIGKAFKGLKSALMSVKDTYDSFDTATEKAKNTFSNFKSDLSDFKNLRSLEKQLSKVEEEMTHYSDLLQKKQKYPINTWNYNNALKNRIRLYNDLSHDIKALRSNQSMSAKALLKLGSVYDKVSPKVQKFSKVALKSVTKGLSKFSKQSIKSHLSIKGFKKDIQTAGKGIKKFTKFVVKDVVTLKNFKKVVGGSAKGLGRFSKSAVKSTFTMKKLKRSLKVVSTGYVTVSKVAYKAGKAMGSIAQKGIAKSLSLIGQKLIGVDEGFGRLAGGGLKQLGQALSDIVRGLLSKGISAFKELAISSNETFASFEMSMKKVKQFGGFAAKDMASVEDGMRNMLKSTVFTAEELQNAFEELAAVGNFSGADGVKSFNEMADAMVKMATATGETDLERTGQILLTTINAFKNQLDESGMSAADVGDILVQVANDSALSVSQIGTAMQYVNQSAAAAGMSLSDTAAIVGFLSNMGFEASRAGTALNQAMKAMIDPSKEAQAIMQDMGISFFDSNGNMKDMVDIANELNQRFEDLGLTTEQQLNVMSNLFGVRGARAVQAMMNETGQLQAMMDDMGNSTGAMQEGMDEMMNSVQGQMSILQGIFEDIKLTIASAFDQSLRQALTDINALLNTPAAQMFFESIGSAVADLINIMMPFELQFLPNLMTIIHVLLPLLNTFATMITYALAPFAEKSGLEVFVKALEMVVNVIQTLLEPLGILIGSLIAGLFPVFEELVSIIYSDVVPVFLDLFALIQSNLPEIIGLFRVLASAGALIAPMLSTLLRAIIPVVGVLLQAGIPVFRKFLQLMISAIPILGGVIGIVSVFANVLTALSPVINFISWLMINVLLNPFIYITQRISDGFNLIMDGFKWIVSALIKVSDAIPGKPFSKTLHHMQDSLDGATSSTKDFNKEVNKMDKTPTVKFKYDNTDYKDLTNETGIPYNTKDETMDIQTQFVGLDGQTLPITEGEVAVDVKSSDLCSEISGNFENLGSSIGDVLNKNASDILAGQVNNVSTSNESPSNVVNRNSNITMNNEVTFNSQQPLSEEDSTIVADNLAEELGRRLV